MIAARPRIAVRGLVVDKDRLLLVNAWPGGVSDLMCAPGGGVELHHSLPDNLRREIYEETGLTVSVGLPVLINEFHDPERDFHQVEVFFRCTLLQSDAPSDWRDPEGVVTQRIWVTKEEMARLSFRPASLIDIAWNPGGQAAYDMLEPILR